MHPIDPDPHCVQCGEVEGHTHIYTCSYNSQVTLPLLQLLQSYMPNTPLERLTCLDWEVEGTAAELSLLVVTVTCLSYVWDRRKYKKPVYYNECKAELEGRLYLM